MMARTTATNFTGGLQCSRMPRTDRHLSLKKMSRCWRWASTRILTGRVWPLAAGAIPNGTITLATMAADSKDSNKIVDGTIATADLANASVTNAKLASDTARANLLTNGGFEIWQRGNGPYTGNGVYIADRWLLTLVDTLSVSRNTANVDTSLGSNYCAACTFTLGSGGGATSLSQPLKTGTQTNSLAARFLLQYV